MISERDRDAIDPEHILQNVFYNPHGTDVQSFAPPEDNVREPGTVVFCGSLSIDTNVDAVLDFHAQVLPLIWQKNPQVRFLVVGKTPPRTIRQLARDPRIEVTGSVPDVRPYLWRATVGIDPIRMAAGMQNKLIEGMAAGLPMVITPEANEGIHAPDGKAVLIGRGATEFAGHVLRLLDHPVEAIAVAHLGMAFVRAHWSWECHFGQLEDHFKTLAGQTSLRLSCREACSSLAPSAETHLCSSHLVRGDCNEPPLQDGKMKITIVGLGYVGAVSAACLAWEGHEVWGVDIDAEKVRILNEGRTPIVEGGLGERIARGCASGLLRATGEIREALAHSEICFIAVATPSSANGAIDSTHLLRACEQIAQALQQMNRRQIVVVRSSVLPRIFDECAHLFHRITRGKATLCSNPEFLREGTAIDDFSSPPFTLLGVENAEAEALLRRVYQHLSAPVYVLPPKEALMVKYASNAYHAVKATFANEFGALCSEEGIDGVKVMAVFVRDIKLNVSARYLRPGFAFGGSCLPKDVRAIAYTARHHDLNLPLIASLMASNDQVVRRAVVRIASTGARRIGLIGLGFKSNTDDLRESPLVDLAERLLGKGCELKIYDPNVAIARLRGANKKYIEKTLPHLSRLLVESPAELAGCELLIVGHNFDTVREFLRGTAIPKIELNPSSPQPLPGSSDTAVAPDHAEPVAALAGERFP